MHHGNGGVIIEIMDVNLLLFSITTMVCNRIDDI